MQWGPDYRSFHLLAWLEAVRVLKPGGFFLLNCKNHLRKDVEQLVTEFHVEALGCFGLRQVAWAYISTPHMRFGANANARLPESVVVLCSVL